MADTHELTQDQGGLVRILLTDHILHRCSVHTITKGSDEGEICDGEECIKVVLFDRLVAGESLELVYSLYKAKGTD
jgi:hypothetical protein